MMPVAGRGAGFTHLGTDQANTRGFGPSYTHRWFYSPGTEVRGDDACAPHAAEKSESLDTAAAFAFLLPSLCVRLTL